MVRVTPLVLLGFAAIWWAGSEYRRFDYGVTSGMVGDDGPLAGAYVYLGSDIHHIRKVTTDSSGAFRFELDPERHEQYRLLICAPGHLALAMLPVRSIGVRLGKTDAPVPLMEQSAWPFPVPDDCGIGLPR
jgi:hypothetical protein